MERFVTDEIAVLVDKMENQLLRVLRNVNCHSPFYDGMNRASFECSDMNHLQFEIPGWNVERYLKGEPPGLPLAALEAGACVRNNRKEPFLVRNFVYRIHRPGRVEDPAADRISRRTKWFQTFVDSGFGWQKKALAITLVVHTACKNPAWPARYQLPFCIAMKE